MPAADAAAASAAGTTPRMKGVASLSAATDLGNTVLSAAVAEFLLQQSKRQVGQYVQITKFCC